MLLLIRVSVLTVVGVIHSIHFHRLILDEAHNIKVKRLFIIDSNIFTH